MNHLPSIIFHSILLSGFTLGTIEAIAISWNSQDTVLAHHQLLASVYAIAPFTLIGFAVAIICSFLTTIWQRTKAVTNPYEDNKSDTYQRGVRSSVATGILSLEIFVAGSFLIAHHCFTAPNREYEGLVLALGTPILGLACFYFWSYLRMRLSLMSSPKKERRAIRALTVAALVGAITPGLFALNNEALITFIGTNSVLFVCAFPVIAGTYGAALILLPPHWLNLAGTRRIVIILLVISSASLADLVTDLDRDAAVKSAVLYDSILLGPLVMVSQPMFDSDNDGYARFLGGGDCDDNDPLVYPGALEIPRNGVDDDCFQGDAPGSDLPIRISRYQTSPSARRVLIKRPNIIHITVDTLAAEHLGFMGYERETSPALDALAQQGVHFLWAFAQGPQTRLSIPSMFTGLYFSEVERTTPLWPRIKESNYTIAETLSDAGYLTAGIPSHRFFLPGYGLNQGFQQWDLSIIQRYQTDIPKHVTGHLVTDRAIDWLQANEQSEEPFYLWLHYFDPHEYYQDHDDIDFGQTTLDLYDEEILYTDRQLARLFKWLKSSPLSSKTYIIVHSDHGEGFGRHGYQRHGQHLYNDQVHVPLVFFGPGIEPRQIEQPVGLIDVLPTIREFAGLPSNSQLQGESLVPQIVETDPPPRSAVFIEMLKDPTHSDRRAMISWPYKLQYGITFSEYSLYNLAIDPQEENNLVTSKPRVFRQMQAELRKWMSTGVSPRTPSD